MKKRITLLLGVTFVGALVFLFFWSTRARTVTLTVVAPAGTEIHGHYLVDGADFEIDGVAPTRFTATGRSVEFTIRKDDQPGQMGVRISLSDTDLAATTAGPGGTVSGGFTNSSGFPGTARLWARTVTDQ